MESLARRKAEEAAPVFFLTGAIWAVLVSALDLACDGYIYRGMGAVWGIEAAFVPFSLGFYLFGAAIGAVCYAASLRPGMRWIATEPAAWMSCVFGVMFMAVGSTLVLDLLAREVLPLFSVPLSVSALVVGFALLDCGIVSVVVAWAVYWVLSGIVPQVPPRRWVLGMGITLVATIIAVFLSNDVRVQFDSSGDDDGVATVNPVGVPQVVAVNPVGAAIDTTLPFVELESHGPAFQENPQ